MENIMFNTSQIEEALVRLEERALELTMSVPSELMMHEHDSTHAEAKALRSSVDALGGEYVRRLDRVQVELMCVRHRCAGLPGSNPKAA